jgi:hypothetical protein
VLSYETEADLAGFVVGFGVSLLGAIMLFIGFTGAFASKLPEASNNRQADGQRCSAWEQSSPLLVPDSLCKSESTCGLSH